RRGFRVGSLLAPAGDPGELEDHVDDLGLLGAGPGLAPEVLRDGGQLRAVLALQAVKVERIEAHEFCCSVGVGRPERCALPRAGPVVAPGTVRPGVVPGGGPDRRGPVTAGPCPVGPPGRCPPTLPTRPEPRNAGAGYCDAG